MTDPLNILIIGCSIAGPTLATFLLLSPIDPRPHITILERSAALRTEGQNVDIRGAGLTIIRKLGLEGKIRASTTGEEGVQWVDSENRVWAEIAAGRKGERTPTADVEILRGDLAQICVQRTRDVSAEVEREGGKGVDFVFGDYLEELEQDEEKDGKVHVRFARSKEWRSFDLVVGADGLQSRTRRMVWGAEGEQERLRSLNLYMAFFSMPQQETDTMWRRWFHAPGRKGIMLRPDQQRKKTTALLSVVNEKDRRFADVAANGSQEEQKQLMVGCFLGVGWESERVLGEMVSTKDFYYDVAGQVKMEKWSKGRVVLMGDAGYCASPISGMGTTLALMGGYNLAGALISNPADFPAAFAEYEHQMRPTVQQAQKLFPGMPHVLHPETAWGVWMTNALGAFITWTRVVKLLFMLGGPPADLVPVEEYGFRQLPEVPLRSSDKS